MKKKTKKMKKKRKKTSSFFHFWRFEPSLANLIWTETSKNRGK